MLQFLSGVSVTCFVTSYLVALALELTRPFFRIPARMPVVGAFTSVGLFTHTVYLALNARDQMGLEGGSGLLASWYDWALLLALGLSISYGILLLLKPSSTLGYFLLPAVLVMIGLSWLLRDSVPFSRVEAVGIWRGIHGVSMLLVTVIVLLGFIAGLMFLVQASRLKHKKLATSGMRLPSLEWLQAANQYCLVCSTALMFSGLFSGVAMHLNQTGRLVWTDRGIILSLVLFTWLVVATLFDLFYKPVRQGQKIAYLTLASFGFLVITLAVVLTSDHGSSAVASVAAGLPLLKETGR